MKNVKILALIACMGMMVLLPNAQAASLSVSPTGSFDASILTQITYNVSFVAGPAESFTVLGIRSRLSVSITTSLAILWQAI